MDGWADWRRSNDDEGHLMDGHVMSLCRAFVNTQTVRVCPGNSFMDY